MTFTLTQSLIFFGIISLTTLATRALPFLLFPDHKEMPKYVKYLGNVLPYTIIGMLVIYCFKDVSFIQAPFGLPEVISTALIILLHLWKKNMLLSIGGGTVLYMLLVQGIF
ncbi:MAG: branched-chain amino acid transport [Anaerocolumna sp.]|jgi:branched-subunit amino acid transport protein AzlD|nr:branched-chain amino acid transport [Anaerocolumna sp.]